MSEALLGNERRVSPETLDAAPNEIIEALMSRGGMIRSLRLTRPIDANSSGILQALLAGLCPLLDQLELAVDLTRLPDYLIGLLESLLSRLPPIRRVELLFDPVPPPIRLLGVALGTGFEQLTFGSRGEGVWNIEAQAIGELLRDAVRLPIDRSIVLANPFQSRCDRTGRIVGLEPWPDAVRRTIRVTSLLHGTRLSFASRSAPLSTLKSFRVSELIVQTHSPLTELSRRGPRSRKVELGSLEQSALGLRS